MFRVTTGVKAALAAGLIFGLAAACAPRHVDRDGRPDANDRPGEQVCCKIGRRDFYATRFACRRDGGRPVHVRQCRID